MESHDLSQSLLEKLHRELIKTKEEAKYWEILATTDDLTGLHNRRMLSEVDARIAERRKSESDTDITLLFIDLDDFGKLNKKYGDDVGDDALRLLGQAIRNSVREDDIAIRKGGDEFVIILIGATPENTNQIVINRLQTMLDGELKLQARDDHLSIKGSIGVFPYNTDISPLDNLKQADELMRIQKQQRKKLSVAA